MKKLPQIFICLALIFLLQSSLFAQTFEWARRSGTSSIATGGAVASDEHGNSYVTGSFFGESTFGDKKFKSISRDAYLVKYDHDGNVLWAKQQSGRGDDFGNAVAIDKDGDCYQAGSFAFTLHLGSDSLVSAGQHDMFIVKYNSKGDLLWFRNAGGYYEDHAMALAVDNAGNVYVAGYFRDTMRFGTDKMLIGNGMSSYAMFLAKYDAKGSLLWAKTLGSSAYATQTEGLGLACDAAGTLYITSYYQHDATFDSKQFTNFGTFSLFVAKYSTDGKMIWAKSAGGKRAAVYGKGIAIDKKGNSYITGTFTQQANFDSITITGKSMGPADIFLAKYNPDGNVLWVRTSTGLGSKVPYGVKTDPDGNPYIIGTFQDTAVFNTTTLCGKGADHIYFVKYDPKGDVEWAKQVGRHGAVLGKDISFDKQSNIYMIGNFSDTIELGKAHLMTSPNTQDVFLAKLSPHSFAKEIKLPDPPAPDFTFLSCEYNAKSRSAILKYSIPKPMLMLLEIDDILGTVGESFIEGQRDSGTYEVKLDLKGLKDDGDYYCRLQAGREKKTKKIEMTR